MPHAVLMPKLGMSMTEGTIVEWAVDVGEETEKGETLLTIDTEKAQVDIEATTTGVLRHIYVQPDETVPCGTLLAAITEAEDDPFDAEAFRAEHAAPESVKQAAPKPGAASAPAPAKAAPARAGAPVTPAARRRARELKLDVAQVPGTGPGGRVTVEDVERWAEQRATLVTVADGVALEIPTAGTGDPVLLLPGFGTDVSVFALQTPALAERYRVLGVNPRGIGASDAPEADAYGVDRLAADAAAAVDVPAHVIGASLGSAVAIELALAHPDRVRSLTLITPFVEATGRLPAVCEAWCRVAREASPDTLAHMLAPWLYAPATLTNDSQLRRALRGLAATLAAAPASTLERTLAGIRAWSGTRTADLARIAFPTLVVTGADDVLTPSGQAVADGIPGAVLLCVPDAGHAVAAEAPEQVTSAILDHLAAVDSRTA